MVAHRQGYRGYVSCRAFGGLQVPVPMQSTFLRDYCARKGFLYKLHVNENQFPHSYMVLEGLLRELDGLEGVLMVSMFMLPTHPRRRRAIYDRILAAGVELHFVLEGLVIRTAADVKSIEQTLAAANLLRYCPKRIPGDPRIQL